MTGFAAIPSEVRRLLVVHGLSATAMGLPWPALLVAVWDQSHSSVALGAAGAARMLPYVALSWLAGRLADRFARGWMVKLSLVLRLALLTATLLLLASGQVGAAVACAALVIACGTPAYPALAAEMPRLAGASNEAATGLLVTFEVAAFFVGPALGGVALSLDVPLASCWAAIVLTAAALWCVLTVPWARHGGRGTAARDRDEPVGVLHVLVHQPAAVAALVAVVINNAVLGAVGIALLPLAREAWDGGAREFGLATAAVGAGAFAAPILLRWLGMQSGAGRRSSLLLAAFLAATVVSPHLLWAFLPLAVAGAAAVHVEAVATGLIQQSAPDSARSSVLGLADSLMVAAGAAGAAVTPWLATWLSAQTVMAICAVGALAMLVLFRAQSDGGSGTSTVGTQAPSGLASTISLQD